jgi:hypothetical protein
VLACEWDDEASQSHFHIKVMNFIPSGDPLTKILQPLSIGCYCKEKKGGLNGFSALLIISKGRAENDATKRSNLA